MITLWFPTAIFDQQYPDHQELKLALEPLILSKVGVNHSTSHWIGNTPNSLNVWNPLNEPMDAVRKFALWVEQQTNEMAFGMGSMNQFGIKEAWANVYEKDNFQENHCHPGSHFSAVYFLSAPPGSGSLKFESPMTPDMMPLTYMNYNEISNETAEYPAQEGQLVVFRSYVRHGVYPNQSNDKRISLAMNLVRKQ